MKTHKQLKDAYQQMESRMGVFQISCLANGKSLVDHSVDMKSRWNRIRTELRFGSHRNRDLQEDWNQYGEDQFRFEILSELKKTEDEHVNYNKELTTLQQLVIEELQINNLYT